MCGYFEALQSLTIAGEQPAASSTLAIRSMLQRLSSFKGPKRHELLSIIWCQMTLPNEVGYALQERLGVGESHP